jgi:hypothetical protein
MDSDGDCVVPPVWTSVRCSSRRLFDAHAERSAMSRSRSGSRPSSPNRAVSTSCSRAVATAARDAARRRCGRAPAARRAGHARARPAPSIRFPKIQPSPQGIGRTTRPGSTGSARRLRCRTAARCGRPASVGRLFPIPLAWAVVDDRVHAHLLELGLLPIPSLRPGLDESAGLPESVRGYLATVDRAEQLERSGWRWSLWPRTSGWSGPSGPPAATR